MAVIDTLISSIINSIFVGFGVAIGTYLANNHFLKKLEKAIQRMKNEKHPQNKRR